MTRYILEGASPTARIQAPPSSATSPACVAAQLLAEAAPLLEGGLELQVRVDGATVDVLVHLDQRRTVGEVLAHLADRDRAALVASGLRALRRLIELGFVVAAGDPFPAA